MNFKKTITKNKELIIIIILAFIIRLIFVPYFNFLDIINYHFRWVKELDSVGLFSIYKADFVDYPPIFIFLLYLFKGPILYTFSINNNILFMLSLKILPIIVDCILVYQIYRFYGKKIALLWTFNVAAIINCAMFGQTDSFLCLFIFLMIMSIKENKSRIATFYFALGCLTKLQMCYFAPLYFTYLFAINKESLGKKIKDIGFGVLVGIIAWLPWIIGKKDLLLPIRIYLNGFLKYDKINMNALNLTYNTEYLINSTGDYNIFGISLSTINIIIYIIIISTSIILLIKFKNFELISSIYLFSIYMFTFSQHERYTMSFLMVVLICYAVNKDSKLLNSYFLCVITTTIMELVVLIFFNLAVKEIIEYGFYHYVVVKYIKPFIVLNILSYLLLIISTGGYIKNNVRKNKEK